MRFGIRELLFVALLLTVPVAAWALVFQPRNEQIAEAKREIRQKQAKLDELSQAMQIVEDLGQEIERLSEAIDLIEKKLPPQHEVDVILRQVWELAKKHKLQTKSVRPSKPVKAADYIEMPIKMEIQGDFDGFYSFLLDLEKLPRITRLPEMTLEKEQRRGNDEGPQMSADIVLSIFFENPRNTPTGGKAEEGTG